MADNSLATLTVSAEDAELAAIAATKNDLSKLNDGQRAQLYGAICKSMGLNPLTSPFEYVNLGGKLMLYAKKGATDQLRSIQGIDMVDIQRETMGDILVVTVTARTRDGRQDTEIGAVNIAGLKGDALANAYMKANTKAKRRVTLSLCGLGWMDETEVETVQNAQYVDVDKQTGSISGSVESDWDRASRRVHAVIEKYGLTHGDLKLHVKKLGYASTSDVPAERLNNIANALEDENARAAALAFYRKLRNESETTSQPESQPQDEVSEESEEAYEGEYSEVDPETGEIIPPSTSGFQSPLIDMPEPRHQHGTD